MNVDPEQIFEMLTKRSLEREERKTVVFVDVKYRLMHNKNVYRTILI
jgi:hypothetical protein